MILVTGGTGFLGSELLRQLTQRGSKVRAIKRTSSLIPEILAGNDDIEWVNADITDYFALADAMEGVDKVFHCAALVSFHPSDEKELHRVNVEGTTNIVNLCLDSGDVKLVHVSSVAAMGDSKPGEPINEKAFGVPEERKGYAFSKYEAEMEVWRAAAEGLNAVVVSPSVIIGANAGYEGSGAIFNLAKKGLSLYAPGSCGFVDVQDVATAMILLMDSSISNERFIINAENYSYRDLFTEAAKIFNVAPPTQKLKRWMLSLAWRGAKALELLNGKRYGITRSTSKSAFEHQNYSNEKIRSAIALNFKPVNQSIAEICAALK